MRALVLLVVLYWGLSMAAQGQSSLGGGRLRAMQFDSSGDVKAFMRTPAGHVDASLDLPGAHR